MSALKYRLRELLPSLSEQAKSCRDRKIRSRLYLIKGIVSSKRTIKAACDFRGVCREQFYQWTKRLLARKNIIALAPVSTRPWHSPRKTKKEIEKKIAGLKRKKPFQGPERLSVAFEDKYSVVIPPSTIYAVLVS